MGNRWVNKGNSERLYSLGLQNHCRCWMQIWNKKMLAPWKKKYDQRRQHIKKQRHHFTNKDLSSQSHGFSSSHVWMWELDHKEGWVPKNWCFQTVVLERTLESPLDCTEIKLWSTLNIHWCWSWSSNTLATWCKSQLTGKDPDAEKDWRQKEKGATED